MYSAMLNFAERLRHRGRWRSGMCGSRLKEASARHADAQQVESVGSCGAVVERFQELFAECFAKRSGVLS